jgi:hypothetical protein
MSSSVAVAVAVSMSIIVSIHCESDWGQEGLDWWTGLTRPPTSGFPGNFISISTIPPVSVSVSL